MRRFLIVLAAGCCLLGPAVVGQAPNSVALEALSRLKGMDLEASPAVKAAVLRVLESTRGTAGFVEIVRDFNLKGQGLALLEFAGAHPAESAGVEAFRMAVAELGVEAIAPKLRAAGLIQAAGNTADKHWVSVLLPLVTDAALELPARKAAVRALAQTQEGATGLLELARADKLDAALKFTAAADLNSARWPAIKTEAAKLLPLPQGADAQALPPLAELLQMKGDPVRGAAVFRRQEVNCISCHQVKGEGTDFGPGLSEIGDKLGKEAIYESILDPSSGISFGFEAWSLELKNGDEAFGLITSETADDLTLKTQAGISAKYKKADLAKRDKMTSSIMPAGLQLTMSRQDLVDLVEYLASLKKKAG